MPDSKLTSTRPAQLARARLCILLLAVFGLAVTAAHAQTSRTFYVSPSGSGDGGTSWTTAWRSPSAIDWTVIQPGDTIELDGGSTACPPTGIEPAGCGVIYNAPLNIGKNGEAGAPITIRLSGEPGRNGTAILDGGQTNFTYCAGAPAQPPPPAAGGTKYDIGIHYLGRSHITVDGGKWGGIVVRNFSSRGVQLAGGIHNTLRHVRVHHIIGSSSRIVGIASAYPSQNVLLDRVEVAWPYQDIFHWESSNSTIQDGYYHNAHCQHADGVQGFIPTNNVGVPLTAGRISNVQILGNVWRLINAPDVNGQIIFLGENVSHQSWWDGVVIRDNLFWLDNPAGRNTRAITTKHASTRNIVIENNTFIGPSTVGGEVLNWTGGGGAIAPIVFRDNIVYRFAPGVVAFNVKTTGGSTVLAGNCVFGSGSLSGNHSETGRITGDPLFTDIAGGDFSLRAGSPCAGKGASITSLDALIGPTPTPVPSATPPTPTQAPATATGSPTASATPVSEATLTPAPTDTPTATPTQTQTASPTAPANCLRLADGVLCFYTNTPAP